MSPKQVLVGDLARSDVKQATAYYLETVGPDVAREFPATLKEAFRHITVQPGTGSPHFAQLLALSRLRHWQPQKFPYLIFYVQDDEGIEIWRILHGHRDIAISLWPSN